MLPRKRVHKSIFEPRNKHQPSGETVQNAASNMPLCCWFDQLDFCHTKNQQACHKNQEDHLDQSKVNGNF